MKPIIIENFADNGAHSHWSVVDGENGKIIIDVVRKMEKIKKIGIIGSRRRNGGVDQKAVREKFFEIYEHGDIICSGGCPQGGDRFAEKIAKDNGIPILIFYPNWKEFGKSAGIIRNRYIADESDILIACVAKDRKGGTEDTIHKYKIACKKNDKNEVVYLI